jgi:uncharacterized protein with PIN domain
VPRVRLEFRGGLEQLLTNRRCSPLVVDVPAAATAGAIIEDLGIPHTEIGSLTINGQPRDPSSRPRDGDALVVCPPRPARAGGAGSPCFILDVHLGRLARLLRLLGFDSQWSRDLDDARLAAIAAAGDRILLSRDRGLLKRRDVRRGCLVRSQEPPCQLEQIVERFDLRGRLAPFSRCLVCNAPLARGSDPRDPRASGACPSCGRRYWRGSHWERLYEIVERVRGGERHARGE